MAINKQLQEKILKISEGVFSTTVDMVLWLTAFSGQMLLPQRPYGAAARASYFANEFIEGVNYQTIKAALNRARSKGWLIKTGRGKRIAPEITAAGRKRLEVILPFYDNKRVWDKRLYLITYDIAEEQRNDRDILREYLRRVGCGMLQQSVWITPYNPQETLREFITERNLKGAVIISCVGKDGSIGEENVKSLVRRIYELERINKKYQEFLEKYQAKDREREKALFAFLSILKEDPQLPFELLPNDWWGEKAYQVYQDYLKREKERKRMV